MKKLALLKNDVKYEIIIYNRIGNEINYFERDFIHSTLYHDLIDMGFKPIYNILKSYSPIFPYKA